MIKRFSNMIKRFSFLIIFTSSDRPKIMLLMPFSTFSPHKKRLKNLFRRSQKLKQKPKPKNGTNTSFLFGFENRCTIFRRKRSQDKTKKLVLWYMMCGKRVK